MPRTRLLTFDELRDHGVVYSRTHIDRLERAGKFPKRVALGSYRVGWVEGEIDAHVATAISDRATGAGALGSTEKVKWRGHRRPRQGSSQAGR